VKLFAFVQLTSDHIFAYILPGTICLSNVLFLEAISWISGIHSCTCHRKVFSPAYSFTKLNANTSLQN